MPMNTPAFSLLMDIRAALAELMAECTRCGAITTQVLKLARGARVIVCSECQTAMPVDEAVFQKLRATQAMRWQRLTA